MENLKLVLGIAIALSFLCAIFFNRSYYRARGRRIEAKAIESITLPEGWVQQRNVLLPQIGDADLVITDPDGGRFVVEIKSFEGAKKAPWWDRKNEIVRFSGKPFSKDAIKQVLSQSDYLGATPILWLPIAKKKKPFTTKSNVVVVQGKVHDLLRVIGAKKGFW